MSDTPLIETEQGSDDSGSTSTDMTVTGSAAGGSPTIVLRFADGSEWALTGDDLLVALATVQTLLLIYVTYQEATS